MSGIAGLYYLDGRTVEGPELARMTGALKSRGPDGEGAWSEGPVGLAHLRLATTPQCLTERLPAADPTGGLAITADARLDNRDELAASLGLDGPAREEEADSGLILKAYQRWGDRCVERLVGDFAFSIWDGPRQAVFCARDHMGVKPFYYHRSGGLFAFASEIKGLLSLAEVPRRLEETRVADYLTPIVEDKATTFYRGILRLPPGHAMLVGRQGGEPKPYWSLDPTRAERLASEEAYDEAFREIFTEAVRCRLPSAFPVASLLSGGLDSSAIACVARDLLASRGEIPHQTYSAVFDEIPQVDERNFIDQVLAQGGLEPHYVRVDNLSPLTDWARVLRYQDEPFISPNLFMHASLFQAAHQGGVRVLLDGVDGDTTVSYGVRYLSELAGRGRWKTLAAEIRKFTRHNPAARPWRMLWRYSVKPLAPHFLRPAWRLLRGQNRLGLSVNPTIRGDFARRVGLMERLKTLEGHWSVPARTTREDHLRRIGSGLMTLVLEAADRASAMCPLEVRYPFFDKRLVEFCLALPSEHKFSNGWARAIHRRAMSGILPPEVAWRVGKACFAINYRRGMMSRDRALLEEVILKDPGGLEEYVDMNALRAAYDRFVSQGAASEDMTVWRAVTLGLWLRQTGLAP